LKSVEILSPEANLSSSHKTKTTSFRRCAIAEADAPRDFLLNAGLKSDFGPVEPDLSIAKSNRAYAVSSDKAATSSSDRTPIHGGQNKQRRQSEGEVVAGSDLLKVREPS
jgi:hypothetical protein